MQEKYKLLKKAEKYLSAGKYERAVSEYRKAVALDGDDTSLLNTLGDVLIRCDQVGEALRVFKKAAGIYIEDGFLAQATAACRKVHRFDVMETDLTERLIDLYLRRESRGEAAGYLRGLVTATRKAERFDGALKWQKRVIELLGPSSRDQAILEKIQAELKASLPANESESEDVQEITEEQPEERAAQDEGDVERIVEAAAGSAQTVENVTPEGLADRADPEVTSTQEVPLPMSEEGLVETGQASEFELNGDSVQPQDYESTVEDALESPSCSEEETTEEDERERLVQESSDEPEDCTEFQIEALEAAPISVVDEDLELWQELSKLEEEMAGEPDESIHTDPQEAVERIEEKLNPETEAVEVCEEEQDASPAGDESESSAGVSAAQADSGFELSGDSPNGFDYESLFNEALLGLQKTHSTLSRRSEAILEESEDVLPASESAETNLVLDETERISEVLAEALERNEASAVEEDLVSIDGDRVSEAVDSLEALELIGEENAPYETGMETFEIEDFSPEDRKLEEVLTAFESQLEGSEPAEDLTGESLEAEAVSKELEAEIDLSIENAELEEASPVEILDEEVVSDDDVAESTELEVEAEVTGTVEEPVVLTEEVPGETSVSDELQEGDERSEAETILEVEQRVADLELIEEEHKKSETANETPEVDDLTSEDLKLEEVLSGFESELPGSEVAEDLSVESLEVEAVSNELEAEIDPSAETTELEEVVESEIQDEEVIPEGEAAESAAFEALEEAKPEVAESVVPNEGKLGENAITGLSFSKVWDALGNGMDAAVFRALLKFADPSEIVYADPESYVEPVSTLKRDEALVALEEIEATDVAEATEATEGIAEAGDQGGEPPDEAVTFTVDPETLDIFEPEGDPGSLDSGGTDKIERVLVEFGSELEMAFGEEIEVHGSQPVESSGRGSAESKSESALGGDDSETAESCLELAQTYRELGLMADTTQTLAIAFRLAQQKGDQQLVIECASLQASVLLTMNEYRRAIEWAEQGLELVDEKHSDWKDLAYHRARALEALGLRGESLASYKRIHQLDRSYRDVASRWVRLKDRSG